MSAESPAVSSNNLPPAQAKPVWYLPESDRNSSNDEINAALFGDRATPDTPTEPPPAATEQKKPELLTTHRLVAEMTAEDSALREQAERDGMPTPRFAIVGGQPWGESRKQLMEAVAVYATTGEVPVPRGDGTSYSSQLVRQCAATGVQPVYHVSKEMREHPSTLEFLEKLGLDPAVVLAENNLGGVLEDLAPLYLQQRYGARLKQDYEKICDELRSGGQREGLSAQQASDELNATLNEMDEITRKLALIDQAIEARLALEDAKIAAVVEQENNNPDTDALIAIMPGYTQQGSETTRTRITDPIKDVDGLSSVIPQAKKIWGEATPQAMLKTAKFIAERIIGISLSAVSRRHRVQIGRGRLVGGPLAKLKEWLPGRVIDGRENIAAWTKNPGKKPVGVLMSAVPASEIIQANRIKPARWGLFGLLGPKILAIVDGGCVTVLNGKTGETETHGNLDPASIPEDGSTFATGHKSAVGVVTSAITVGRSIRAATHRFYERREAWLTKQLTQIDRNQRIAEALGGLPIVIPARTNKSSPKATTPDVYADDEVRELVGSNA